nr:hypothetical protein [Tanacetum cinerariifolium]
MGSYTLNQLKKLSFDEIKKLFKTTMKRVNTFVPMETEVRGRASKLAAGSSKRQKTNEASGSVQKQPAEEENELSQEDLQQMMMIVILEEVYVKALHVKYPIIDWEVYTKISRKYWKIIRVEPTNDKERTLWFELKRLFEPDTDDTLWKLHREKNGYFHAGRERISIVKRGSDFD